MTTAAHHTSPVSYGSCSVDTTWETSTTVAAAEATASLHLRISR
nr:hypothetical protein [Streptomyces antibioticus]